MNDSPSEAASNRHLGFRIAVGVAGLALLALVIVLGRVAGKQSATTQALESYESLQEAPRPATPAAIRPAGNP